MNLSRAIYEPEAVNKDSIQLGVHNSM